MTGREKKILRKKKKKFAMFPWPARNLFYIFVKQEEKIFL